MINPFAWVADRLRRDRPVPPGRTLSKKQVTALVLARLPQQGWAVTRWHNMWGVGVFAHKGNMMALVYCSGADFPLHGYKCNQVRQAGQQTKRYVAFVHGDVAIPAWREHVQFQHEALLPVQEIAQFDAAMQALTPSMVGAVETIDAAGLVTGFVRLTPQGRARVVATRNGVVLGACTADILRPDLKRWGDGRYGFRLQLADKMTAADVMASVVFDAHFDAKHLGPVKYDIRQS